LGRCHWCSSSLRRRVGGTDLRAYAPSRGRDPADGVTFLSCEPAEAVRIGLAAAGGKNLEVFSPTIGRQLLELGLIDEIDLHIAPILLGDGIRLYDCPGGDPIRLHRVGDGAATSAVNVCYRPIRTTNIAPQKVSG
jgi:dihydrofolate reductase